MRSDFVDAENVRMTAEDGAGTECWSLERFLTLMFGDVVLQRNWI